MFNRLKRTKEPATRYMPAFDAGSTANELVDMFEQRGFSVTDTVIRALAREHGAVTVLTDLLFAWSEIVDAECPDEYRDERGLPDTFRILYRSDDLHGGRYSSSGVAAREYVNAVHFKDRTLRKGLKSKIASYGGHCLWEVSYVTLYPAVAVRHGRDALLEGKPK